MFKSFRFFRKVLKETALDPFCFQRLQSIFKKEFSKFCSARWMKENVS